jgi:multidrug transporter EmrE-like cation transporter
VPWLYLFLTVLLNTGASLLLKLSAGGTGLTRLITVFCSMACYALSFASYYACLRSFPVSIAYPVITGGAILTIVLFASPVLNEPLTAVKGVGACFIVIGGILLLRQT